MILPSEAIAIAAAVLALGGIGAGTAAAATPLPAVTVSHSTVDPAEPGDVPDVPVHNHHNRDRLQDLRHHENSGTENAGHRPTLDRSQNTSATHHEHSATGLH